jgi:hypothetical protein
MVVAILTAALSSDGWPKLGMKALFIPKVVLSADGSMLRLSPGSFPKSTLASILVIFGFCPYSGPG